MPGRREIALIAASLLFAGILAEIGLRITGIAYPVFHRLETLRGWSPQPGISGVWMTEGQALIENNDEGFRDRNHAIEKPEGTLRIAVIGDSMSEALAVPIEKTFWSVLEKRLSACQGQNVEVLNFSVSGYGSAQQRLTLKHNALKYSPDIVMLAFFTGNDVWNNERALDGHEDRVYYVLEGGTLTLDDSNTKSSRFQTKMFWRGILNGTINASRLFQLVREFSTRTKNMIRGEKPKSNTVFNSASRDYEVFKTPATPEWNRAWETTEALLAAMRDDVKASSADFWVANLTAPVQVYPDRQVRREFAETLDVNDLGYPDRRIAEVTKRLGIPSVSLLGPMQRHADAENAYLHGFDNTRLGTGHWNALGHRLAGEYLANTLCVSIKSQTK